MRKVLLSCMALAAGTAMVMAQDEAVYPSTLDFTLNGEKELTGVSVNQSMVPFDGSECLTIEITGESDANVITMDFETPAGWDYSLISSAIGGADSPFATRSGDWYPVKDVMAMGYAKGDSFKFPVNGKESLGTIYLVKGDNVWEYSIDIKFNVSKAEGAVEAPAFPDHLDYTLNGEKELPGIMVRQGSTGSSYIFSVTGNCNSDKISVTFETPEGWDSLMISDMWGEGEISTVKTRSVELIPVKDILGQGFKEGNTITFKTDGEAQMGSIALIKGDMACLTFINYDITVSKSSGSDDPGDDEPGDDEPLIPESIGITTYADGLIIEQEKDQDDGSINIDVTGSIAEEEYDLVLDVPEGWDGFVILPFSENITVGNHNVGPRKISASDHEWVPIEFELAEGYIKGNKLTFKATGNWEFAYAYLYKGDQVDENAFIGITAKVSQELYKVSTSCPDLDVTQGEFDGVCTVTVTGECPEDEYTVTIETPEGWDGFIGYTDCDYNPEIEPLKRIQDPEWVPVEDMLKEGLKITNSLIFPADGEEHYGKLIPFKGEVADVANAIMIEVYVTKAEGDVPAPEIPETFVITSSCPDLQIEQIEDEEVFLYSVTGECPDDEFTITVEVPEGWDGFIGNSDIDYNYDIMPFVSKKVMPTEWWPIDEMIEEGMRLTNTFTFPADGEEHSAQLMLVKDGLADVMNSININVLVSKSNGSAVESINSVNSNAIYYDTNGNKTAKPAKGVYVKVVEGNATKVIVK